ncbi:ATP-grasp domain-containing protein [Chitinophaga nivalis]|uniref:ATP-grasp domain-containing protein n=1 Tax=Chitinophaga nivalis TaxID=2991709 RepID=A0ABT3IGB2_9BACT|nr:hypothetical protein [Chitinophaga nivalis]MCW3467315.1 hypothetical protein [Chitinophaga nivalis]MCW3482993.1 hypothetical protein [Chitinophaga nivalis]
MFAIYHEHPDWFRPLFQELDRRGIVHIPINPVVHRFNIAVPPAPYELFFNSTPAATFEQAYRSGISYTLNYLAHLEVNGIRVINGYKAFTYAASRALQLILLESLGLDYPASVVVNQLSQLTAAAGTLRFPVVIKHAAGNSIGGAIPFDSAAALQEAIAAGSVTLGPDHTAIVQEFIPTTDGYVNRVVMLGGKFWYAFRIAVTDTSRTAVFFTPPQAVIAEAAYILQHSSIDVGSVTWLNDERDGKVLYLGIHTDITFNTATPIASFAPLADYLVEEAAKQQPPVFSTSV